MKRNYLCGFAVAMTSFAIVSNPSPIFAAQANGDLNQDGLVNAMDVEMFRNYLLGLGDILDIQAADFNEDGVVNAIDYALLKKGIATGEVETDTNTEPKKIEYADKIFGNEIISVEILANESDWQAMLANAKEEEYIKVDVMVNGTKFTDVGIRPKGNSSLTQVAALKSSRYSFRLKFDKYVDKQSCFGLKSMVLNNMFGDNTYMKEYISYDLMKTVGVKVPLFGYSNITVNGKPWGTYLAVELYSGDYEKRVFGDKSGKLYNVKMTSVNTNNNNNGQPGAFAWGGFTSRGGSLQYKDDNSSSYPDIFENSVGKTEEADYQRVIAALKALSVGNDLEGYYDVDAILAYLAAHTFVVNLDSYSSMMAQNYYIYEKEGNVTILPWDYNFAWGGFMTSDAKSVINFPIDTPVSGVKIQDRPLIDKFLAKPAYLQKYHQYLKQLVEEYFANGKFEEKVTRLNTRISQYVKDDVTAFCTYDKYEKAVVAFKKLGRLRGQSVDGQLRGTIPSTSEEQGRNSSKLLGSEDLKLSDLGELSWGGGAGKWGH